VPSIGVTAQLQRMAKRNPGFRRAPAEASGLFPWGFTIRASLFWPIA
jgi:hypothetical protein